MPGQGGCVHFTCLVCASWYGNVTFLVEDCKTQALLLPLRAARFCSQITVSLFFSSASRYQRVRKEILRHPTKDCCCALILHSIRAQNHTGEWASIAASVLGVKNFLKARNINSGAIVVSASDVLSHTTQRRIKIWGLSPRVQPRVSSVVWNSHTSHSNKAEVEAAKGKYFLWDFYRSSPQARIALWLSASRTMRLLSSSALFCTLWKL